MKKLLVVDDAAFMRLAIINTIKKDVLGENVDIIEAVDGAEAVKKYQEEKPDVVTMDITMPNMTGIEALKLIMQLDPKAKVIIVSALGQENMVKEAIICGARSFIVKPFKGEHVINAINKLLAV